MQDLQKCGELPLQEKPYSIYPNSTVGSFKFCVINKTVPHKNNLGSLDSLLLHSKQLLARLAGSRLKWYGLDTATVITETVPLFIAPPSDRRRISRSLA